ncbi:ABC transporter ATP-binding protein [Kitasatospora sp. A2-31]|uniref:ABC transporter ATP-binding protein n=1 Tax=Kitasatospora sp. A2-31 TaxID=2916414 RepID=UPI001EEAF538|nr:ABC transporter ATP-binding protein [Kitasatospora sp. A2-31]MCG6495857.1 ABC transporter ATP-binding protein/permease [Kitasatospora sp. A2-31]
MADQPPNADTPVPPPVRLRRELAAQPVRLVVALLLAVAATAAGLALPLLVQKIVGDFSAHRSLAPGLLMMAGAAVGGALAQALSGFQLARIGERMTYRLRVGIMAHALRLPLPVVRARGTGDLAARVTSDAQLLRQVVEVATQLPLAALSVLATLGVMVWIDWVLTAVTVAALAVLTVLVLLIMRRMRANVSGQQDAVGRIAQRFTANLEALTTIKAYRAEPVADRALAEDAEELRAVSLTGARLGALVPAVLTLGNQFAMIAVILTGGARMAAGDLEVAAFAAFLLYLLQTVPSVNTLATGFGRLQAGLAARDRCNELLALSPEADPDDADRTAPDPAPDAPAVVFRSVTYTHGGSQDAALRAVSFSVPRTGLTAVVGPSGAGKTTALSLIGRFVRPSAGAISVLGHDAGSWPLAALRARMAYVDQAFTLLEATARENLQLGRVGAATDGELAEALAAVGLTEDVARLPQGLDTVLGRESDLSGGQRQRMALARALLADADIVLLDEPTSQLDGLNELRFREIVERLARHRAVVVVAHRLTTVQRADHVIMMNRGTVVDAADHPTLLTRCLPYRELVASQAGPSLLGGR